MLLTTMKTDKYSHRLAAASLLMLLHPFLSALADRLRFACYSILFLSSLLLESVKGNSNSDKRWTPRFPLPLAYRIPEKDAPLLNVMPVVAAPVSIAEDDVERSMARRKKGAPPMNINKKCMHCDKVFMRPCDLT